MASPDSGPRATLNLRAAVALNPIIPNLPVATYMLIEHEGTIRQITSSVYDQEGNVTVIFRDKNERSHIVSLSPDTIVELRQYA